MEKTETRRVILVATYELWGGHDGSAYDNAKILQERILKVMPPHGPQIVRGRGSDELVTASFIVTARPSVTLCALQNSDSHVDGRFDLPGRSAIIAFQHYAFSFFVAGCTPIIVARQEVFTDVYEYLQIEPRQAKMKQGEVRLLTTEVTGRAVRVMDLLTVTERTTKIHIP